MFRSIIAAAFLAAVSPSLALAQDSAAPDSIASAFFGALKSGQVATAYQNLWRGTLMDKKQADVEFIANQTSTALRTYGPIAGWEEMSSDDLSQSLKSKLYLLRGENGPLFFRLQFYHGPKGGIV